MIRIRSAAPRERRLVGDRGSTTQTKYTSVDRPSDSNRYDPATVSRTKPSNFLLRLISNRLHTRATVATVLRPFPENHFPHLGYRQAERRLPAIRKIAIQTPANTKLGVKVLRYRDELGEYKHGRHVADPDEPEEVSKPPVTAPMLFVVAGAHNHHRLVHELLAVPPLFFHPVTP